jgi:ATP phosphoribosyltransferase
MAEEDDRTWCLDRDGDMVGLLRELPGSIGFMGSDRYDELEDSDREAVAFTPILATLIRFAVATCEEKAERIAAKLERVEPLVVATTYRKKTVAVIADIWRTTPEEAATYVETLYFGGSIESKPKQIPRVDGVLDIIDSGATMAANKLTIVRDNLGTVSVGAVWSRNDKP